MAPTQGRIVLFQSSPLLPTSPALVTWVWDNDMVNLTVFMPDGSTTPKTSVPYHDVDDTYGFQRWYWPPRAPSVGQEVVTETIGVLV